MTVFFLFVVWNVSFSLKQKPSPLHSLFTLFEKYFTGFTFVHFLYFTAGFYIYIEASNKNPIYLFPGDKARLESPVVVSNGKPKCLRFWYHMRGFQIGSLNVYQQNHSVETLVWFKNKTISKDDVWKQCDIQFPHTVWNYTVSNFSYSNILIFINVLNCCSCWKYSV